MGWDIINVTAYPEGYLARLCDAAPADIWMVADHDVGVSERRAHESRATVLRVFTENNERLASFSLRRSRRSAPARGTCSTAPRGARVSWRVHGLSAERARTCLPSPPGDCSTPWTLSSRQALGARDTARNRKSEAAVSAAGRDAPLPRRSTSRRTNEAKIDPGPGRSCSSRAFWRSAGTGRCRGRRRVPVSARARRQVLRGDMETGSPSSRGARARRERARRRRLAALGDPSPRRVDLLLRRSATTPRSTTCARPSSSRRLPERGWSVSGLLALALAQRLAAGRPEDAVGLGRVRWLWRDEPLRERFVAAAKVFFSFAESRARFSRRAGG